MDCILIFYYMFQNLPVRIILTKTIGTAFARRKCDGVENNDNRTAKGTYRGYG